MSQIKVKIISHSPEPEKVICSAARLCYSSLDIDEIIDSYKIENSEKFVDMLVKLGHESPLEHVTFTFGIENVSRIFLSQLTRHRIASYSVRSQRYVKEVALDGSSEEFIENLNYVIPPAISENEEAKKEFLSAIFFLQNIYKNISEILKKTYEEKSINNKDYEKKAIEDARYILPGATKTKIICTFNARSLLNFFSLRCCKRAQWEIRIVANEMLKIVKKILPSVFKYSGPPCISKKNCNQGSLGCFFKGD